MQLGTAGNPLVGVATNSQLDAAATEAESAATPIIVSEIAGYIRARFQEAERHKTQFITPRLLECQRRVEGKYDATKLAAIKAAGGCDSYFNFTETKKSALEAWIQDNIADAKDKPWGIEPTPIPDIPERAYPDVIAAAVHEFQISGEEPTPDNVGDMVMRVREEMLKRMTEEAAEKIKKMERKIEDQLEEADFNAVLAEFIDDLATYPTAFLKGPELRSAKKLSWNPDGELTIGEELKHAYTSPSPFDIYPAPNARNIQEGDLCEIVTIGVTALAAMRGQPGWNTEAINAVLQEVGTASMDITDTFLYGQAERAWIESRDPMINGGIAPTTLRGLDFWGLIKNEHLTNWGMTKLEGEPFDYTQVNALMFGRHVVYAIQNPHPLGERPYSATSVKKVKGSLWGKAIPEIMEDCQDAACASLRNLIDNLAYCAGPMLAVDVDAMPADYDVQTVQARAVLQFNGSKLPPTGSRKAYDFFQPSANAQVLLDVTEYFDAKADDRTQIPRYAHGNEDVGGAGQTASGMSMLMTNAAKGVKRVLGNLDRDILRSVIQRQYTWNMLHLDDPSIKGDAKVVPRGVMAMLIREQTQLRRQEFLVSTANEYDMQIIGIEGRAAVLRKIVEGLDMPVDKVVPPEEVLQQRIQEQMQAQAQQAMVDAAANEAPEKAAA